MGKLQVQNYVSLSRQGTAFERGLTNLVNLIATLSHFVVNLNFLILKIFFFFLNSFISPDIK